VRERERERERVRERERERQEEKGVYWHYPLVLGSLVNLTFFPNLQKTLFILRKTLILGKV